MEAKSQHYRALAEKSRRLAKGIEDPEIKVHMLEVAAQYEKLAGEAEAKGD